MCKHGTYEYVEVFNPNQAKSIVPIDKCIASEIRFMNHMGIITLGSCCGHGRAGQVEEFENGFGKWKTFGELPHALIDAESVKRAKELDYRPFKYYYADGEFSGIYKVYLRNGDLELD